jgi:hypothetical protein
MEEKEEFDRLVEFAEMDVPVDFGDEDVDEDEDNTTIQAIPQEVTEEGSEEMDPTRIWDITVPIRETSILSEELNMDAETIGKVDATCESFEPVNRGQCDMDLDDAKTDPRNRIIRKSRTPQSRRESKAQNGTRSIIVDNDPVETNRGLNISKIGLDNPFDPVIGGEIPHLDPEPVPEAPSLVLSEVQQIISPDDHFQGDRIESPPAESGEYVEEVDFASRVVTPRWAKPAEEEPNSSNSSRRNSRVASRVREDDSLGFAAAERYMKRESKQVTLSHGQLRL